MCQAEILHAWYRTSDLEYAPLDLRPWQGHYARAQNMYMLCTHVYIYIWIHTCIYNSWTKCTHTCSHWQTRTHTHSRARTHTRDYPHLNPYNSMLSAQVNFVLWTMCNANKRHTKETHKSQFIKFKVLHIKKKITNHRFWRQEQEIWQGQQPYSGWTRYCPAERRCDTNRRNCAYQGLRILVLTREEKTSKDWTCQHSDWVLYWDPEIQRPRDTLNNHVLARNTYTWCVRASPASRCRRFSYFRCRANWNFDFSITFEKGYVIKHMFLVEKLTATLLSNLQATRQNRLHGRGHHNTDETVSQSVYVQ